jgi:flagellar biosynthesis component FlhA
MGFVVQPDRGPEARDRERLVESLGLPVDAAAPRRYIADGGAASADGLAALVDAEVTERTWRRWYPGEAHRLASPGFAAALEALLAAGARMGYALDRFRSVCQDLPEPDPDGERWVEPFESAVAARNAVDLRVFVRRDVREALLAPVAPARDSERWEALTTMMGDGLFYELGIVLPRLELLTDDTLDAAELRIEVNDACLPRGSLLPADRALVNESVHRLRLLGVQGEEAVNPANGSECAVIAASDVKTCEAARLTTWDRAGHAILTISAVARRMAGAFINRHLVDFHTGLLAQAFPTIVDEVRKAMSRDSIAQVLRALVDEEIAIRNLLRIFEVLVQSETRIAADLGRYIVFAPPAVTRALSFRDGDRDAPAVERRLSRIRAAMKREISHKYTRGGSTLVVYLLESALEKRLAQPRPLSAVERAALLAALRAEIGSAPMAQAPVILTASSVRLRLRREIAAAFPTTAVLAYQELSPDLNIQPLARIEVPELIEDAPASTPGG